MSPQAALLQPHHVIHSTWHIMSRQWIFCGYMGLLHQIKTDSSLHMYSHLASHIISLQHFVQCSLPLHPEEKEATSIITQGCLINWDFSICQNFSFYLNISFLRNPPFHQRSGHRYMIQLHGAVNIPQTFRILDYCYLRTLSHN